MVKVILFGYHEYAAIGLEELLRADANVVALVTHEDSASENVWYRTPAALARERGIPVYTPEDPNAPEFLALLRDLAPDLVLSIYYRQLLCQEILALPSLGALNLHGSLLPKYRGRCPVNWVLVSGEMETGVTLHHMVERADAGDIVAQASVRIAFDDTALTLHRKLFAASRTLLRRWLPAVLSGTAPRTPQDHTQATYFGGRKPEDGLLDWGCSATVLHNLVRAVAHPYPGAFTYHEGKKLFVWQAHPAFDRASWGKPGEVLDTSGDDLFVATGSGVLRVGSLQLDGGPELTAAAAHTAKLVAPGEVLGA